MCNTEWTRRYFLKNAAAAAAVPALAAIPLTANAAPAPRTDTPARVSLTNVRVFDGHGLTAPTTVVIDDGVIGVSTIGTQTIDAQGAVLLPGLIDAHVHVRDVPTLHTLTGYGVTTALDMGCWPPALTNSLRNQTGLCDIRSAGIPAVEPGSVQSQLPGFPQSELITSSAQAWPFVAARAAEGSDYIKIIVDVPGLNGAIVTSLTRAAHSYGKAVMGHAVSDAAIVQALQAGIDMIHHTPLDSPLSADTVTQYVTGRHVSVPTLTTMQGFANLGIPGLNYQAASASVTALHQAGVQILAGTDSNLLPGIPVNPPFGASLHNELALLVQAGLSNVDALRAATVLPARAFGLDDRGVISPGLRADLILVDGDPTTDITATRNITRIWARGIEYPVAA